MPRRTTVDPTFDDLHRREVIWLKCRCGKETCFKPQDLIGKHGITLRTPIFGLQDRFRCKAKRCGARPERMWLDKWQD
jgi:hypothetical protein